MKFWSWAKNDADEGRELRLDGVIAEESWLEDEISPKEFKRDLYSSSGPVTVWINSPGGDVFAGSQIYNMIKEYPGKVTVKIDGLAASAASVVAMAGDDVLISPVGMLMIHNPWTMAIGEAKDMDAAKRALNECKESIMNAYELKTGMTRSALSKMMDAETYISAMKAVELKFADGILYQGESAESKAKAASRMQVFAYSLKPRHEEGSVASLRARLEKLKKTGDA